MKSSVVYAAILFTHVCIIWDNDLTEYQVCYKLTGLLKKPLDNFSPQIERKRSKHYLVIISAVKEIFERFSCLEFVFEKSKLQESGLKHKLQIFRGTLILVFLNENCRLCICFTKLYFFFLIVSGLSCNFNRCDDCFQSFSEQRFQEYSKCRALNYFKIKNKHNKFFIMLERNLLMFIQTLAKASTAKVRTGWPYRWFWKFF